MHIESASGIVLLACTALALFLANSPWADRYFDFWKTPFRIGFPGFELKKPLLLWVNDALMTLFFFVVGLEIKREMVAGELKDPRKAALPLFAAAGGMVVPAGVFLLLQAGEPGERGWGIPMATDIAFVVGFLALFGKRVPFSLKILLLTLAIADDIGAVLVIAAFYTTDISFEFLALGCAGFVATYGLNRAGVRTVPVYVLVGAVIWVLFLKSGVHPTVAGVMLGLLTPASAWIGQATFMEVLGWTRGEVESNDTPDSEAFNQLAFAARESISPLERLEHALHPWVGFVIMPTFALANAGVAIAIPAIKDPLSVAVALGLAVGKPLGVMVFAFFAVKLGIARLPQGVNWPILLGGGCLSGIGFTMSLFIAGLALNDAQLDAGKVGTLTGSAISAIAGSVILLLTLRHATTEENG